MSSLLLPLLQVVKNGFTKAVQRLDGIYALFCVVKIAAVDVKAGAYLSGFNFCALLLFYSSYFLVYMFVS